MLFMVHRGGPASWLSAHHQREEPLPGKLCFQAGQSLIGLVTASVRVLGVVVSAGAVDRAGLVLAFKLSVGTGREDRTLVNIYDANTKRGVGSNTATNPLVAAGAGPRSNTCAVLPVPCETGPAGAGVVVFGAAADGVLVAGEGVWWAAHV